MNHLSKTLIAVFMMAMALTFFASTHEARAVLTYFHLTLGHGNKCIETGICKMVIFIQPSFKGNSQPPPNETVMIGDAEVKGNYLVIKFKDPPYEKMKNEKGEIIFPFDKPTTIKPSEDSGIGYSELSIAPGSYRLEGQVLKIRLADRKKQLPKDQRLKQGKKK